MVTEEELRDDEEFEGKYLINLLIVWFKNLFK
jgi:hypothetical protein